MATVPIVVDEVDAPMTSGRARVNIGGAGVTGGFDGTFDDDYGSQGAIQYDGAAAPQTESTADWNVSAADHW